MQYYRFSDPSPDDMRTRAKNATSRVALSLFVLMLVSNVASLIIQLLVRRFAPAVLSAPWFLWAVTIVSLYAVAAPFAYLILRGVPKSAPARRRMSLKTFLIFLAMSFALMIAGVLLGTGVNSILERFFGEQDSAITEAIRSSTLWLSCLYSLVIAPLFEELFFRKFLLDRLGFLGDTAAILLSGIAFGLFHGNVEQFCYAALLGMLLALLYLKTGNLLYPVLTHAIVNFFGGILPTLVEHLTEVDFSTADITTLEQLIASHPYAYALQLAVGLLPYLFALVGTVFFCLYLRRLLSDLRPSPLPSGERAAPLVGNVGSILYLVLSIGSMLLSAMTA